MALYAPNRRKKNTGQKQAPTLLKKRMKYCIDTRVKAACNPQGNRTNAMSGAVGDVIRMLPIAGTETTAGVRPITKEDIVKIYNLCK